MSEDTALLRRFAHESDEAALTELVQRYLGLVYHAAERQLAGDSHLSEDVTQKVFVLLARKASRLTQHTTLAGWLHTTTRNVAREAQRGERRRRIHEQEAFNMQESTRDWSGAEAAWADLRPVIDEALGELDGRDREVVLLRYFTDLPYAQIGERLALSENAARMRVERALDRLHERLARRGITSTSTALGVVLAQQAGAATAVVPVGLAGSVTSAALAGTAATGVVAPLVGIIEFMSTTKVAVGVAAILGVAGLGIGVFEYRQAAQTATAVAALRRDVAGLQSRLAQQEANLLEAGKRVQAEQARATELEAELAKARTAVARATTPRAATNSATATFLDPGLKDPEYVRLSLQRYRAEIGSQYALLYRRLQLTPEQIVKFEENRTKMRQAELDLMAAAGAKDVAPNDPALKGLIQQMMGEVETDLRTMLGDVGYQQYSEYRRALSAVAVVDSLASRTYATAEPLGGMQGEQLTEIIVNQTQSVPVAPGSRTVRYETDWTAVRKEAKRVLSPGQSAALQALTEIRELQARMAVISRDVRNSAGSPSP